MRAYTFTENGFTFERVDKRQARKAYNNGLRVVVCPVNLRPGYPWHPEISVSGKSGATFEEMLNAFIFYNTLFYLYSYHLFSTISEIKKQAATPLFISRL